MDELLTFEVLLEKYFYAKTLRPDTQWSYCKVVRTFTKFAKVLPGGGQCRFGAEVERRSIKSAGAEGSYLE